MNKSNKIKCIIAGLVMLQLPLMAADSMGATIMNWIYNNMFIFLSITIFIAAFITILNLLLNLIKSQRDRLSNSSDFELEDTGVSSFQKWKNKAWGYVDLDKEDTVMLHHDFDGIHELDNRLPPWWVYLFYITIIWGAVYFYMFQISDNKVTQTEEYYAAMEVAKEEKRAYALTQANSVDEYTVEALTEEADLAAGKKLFITNCASCHGQLGEGTVGPNLTDEYWIHGGGVKNIFKTIKYGVPEKGMIAWKAQMSASTIQKLASYILTLEGTNPPNGKAKEGELYKGEEAGE